MPLLNLPDELIVSVGWQLERETTELPDWRVESNPACRQRRAFALVSRRVHALIQPLVD